jgi:PAS domain S-box-containing protein
MKGLSYEEIGDRGLTVNNMNQISDARILNSIFQSIYDGVYVADKDGKGVMVNDSYSRLTGVPASDLLGKNMRDVVKEKIVSDSVTLKVLSEKRTLTIVQTIRNKEFLVTGTPVFDEDEQIIYVVTTVRDISELTRLRNELQHTHKLANQYLNDLEEFKSKEILQQHLEGVVAQSREITKVFLLAQKVAKVNSTVLLLGETGVGKEVVVNLIHKFSDRSNKPLIKVNCGAIPEQLLESELFGYEKGAFTGADPRGKPGLIEQANGGTIFLDEIGDMPLDLQVKLLRFLQEFEITRVGGRKSISLDVRVISATNKNLESLVDEGTFRQDLYYRLNIVPIKIPPLRKRRGDIAPLAYFFLNKMNGKYKLNKKFHSGVIQLFEEYSWPGNIREMENMVERLVVITEEDEIKIKDIPLEIPNIGQPQKTSKLDLKQIIQNVERKIIREVIEEEKTTRKAAEKLNISQSTLVKKMQRLGL